MNIDFRIVLMSDDPYHLGLLKGYCHARHYKFFKATTDRESINATIQMQPNIVVLAVDPLRNQAKADIKLLRELSLNHKIPVCYLRGPNNLADVEEEIICWVDAILDAPLDINQLNDYLHKKFEHHPQFIREKRNRNRRAAADRRLIIVDPKKTHQLDDGATVKGDNYGFMTELFQIDQRSKTVLFNGKSLHLTRKEFDLFELLAQDVDRVFMTHEIINHLWPENNRATKSDLYQYMHLLRKKIENDPNNPQWILTMKGFGYKLNVASPAKNLPSS